MGLSTDLISQFAKITNDASKSTKTESIVYGTTTEFEENEEVERVYVKFDGSDLLTPVTTASNTGPGERVIVTIKNHEAIVTGNISYPSARINDVPDVAYFENIVSQKVDTKDLETQTGRIDVLESDKVTIYDRLDAADGKINNLESENVKITGNLTAQSASITDLQAKKLDADVARNTYATIVNLTATNAQINDLDASFGDFKTLNAENLAAMQAEIDNIEAGQIDVMDSGWITAPPETGFTLYTTSEPIQYRKIGKIVEIRGAVKPMTTIPGSTTNHTICTLPEGFRPSYQVTERCTGSDTHTWLLSITSGGAVRFARYNDGTNWIEAGTSTWLPFRATFFVD